MPIKFTCPHCKRGMIVDDRMAGKKGRCKACQQVITVPNHAVTKTTPQPPAASPSKPVQPAVVPPKANAAPPAPADVEAEAAALFSDEPPPAAPTEAKTIDLNCPFCDEPIHFGAELAGKKAPCPECRRIIKVPELVKNEPKDWRKADQRGPSGARQPDQPAPEGAWGSTTASTVSKQAFVEAGVIPKTRAPRTFGQKVMLPGLAIGGVILLSLGGWLGYRWWSGRAIERALKEALDYAASEQGRKEANATGQAALYLGAGEFYLRGQGSRSGPEARNQFGKALAALQSAPADSERDALLADLALAQVELGGDEPDIGKELRIPWKDTQQLLQATLSAIQDLEARREAVRAVCQRLIARGQTKRVLPLAGQVYSTTDGETAATLAVVGMELLKANDKASAETAADQALAVYEEKKEKKPPPMRPEVIALALALQKNTPKLSKGPDDKAIDHLGQVEFLARQEQWDKARQLAARNEYGDIVQFQALLAIVAASADNKSPEMSDVEAAVNFGEAKLKGKPELSWPLLRLTRLAVRAGFSEERLQTFTDIIADRSLRGRAQLAVFRGHLAQTKQSLEESTADKIESKSLARRLAGQELARHNTRLNSGWADTVQGWQQPLKAFGSLGVALGLQDRQR